MSSEEKDKPSPSPNRPLSWLKPKQSEKHDSTSITSGDPTTIDVDAVKPVEDDANPVSFFGLFKSVFISVLFIYTFYTVPPPPDSPLVRRSYSMSLLSLVQLLLAPPRSVFLFHLPYSSLPD